MGAGDEGGIVASPSGLATQLVPAVVLGLVLLLLARPLSVLVSLTPFRVPLREQAFLSWAGLRGAVPVVLATVPITAGVPDVEWVYDLVLVLVVYLIIVIVICRWDSQILVICILL